MKKYIFVFALAAFAFASVSEAGPIRNLIGRIIHRGGCGSCAQGGAQYYQGGCQSCQQPARAACPCGVYCRCSEEGVCSCGVGCQCPACPARIQNKNCPDGNCPLPSGVKPSPVLAPALPEEAESSEDAQQKDPNPNFGLNWDKIEEHKVSLAGKDISAGQASDRIAGQVPDDASKLRLVVIGTAEERKPVMDQWAKLEPAVKDRLSPWSVDIDNFSLKDAETGKPVFVTDGHPTVYVQAPDGKVLHRQDDFPVNDNFQGIRKAVKAYDSAKDVDLRKTTPGGNSTPLLVAGGAAALLLLARRKQ